MIKKKKNTCIKIKALRFERNDRQQSNVYNGKNNIDLLICKCYMFMYKLTL